MRKYARRMADAIPDDLIRRVTTDLLPVDWVWDDDWQWVRWRADRRQYWLGRVQLACTWRALPLDVREGLRTDPHPLVRRAFAQRDDLTDAERAALRADGDLLVLGIADPKAARAAYDALKWTPPEVQDDTRNILGFRVWDVSWDGLRSITAKEPWPTRLKRAGCSLPGEVPHDETDRSHAGRDCGVHATYAKSDAKGLRRFGLGIVVSSGLLRIHGAGWRAAGAEILALGYDKKALVSRNTELYLLHHVAENLGVREVVPEPLLEMVGCRTGRLVTYRQAKESVAQQSAGHGVADA
jgi:hypothetical protein